MNDPQAFASRYLKQSRLIRKDPTADLLQHHRQPEFLSDVLARLGVSGLIVAPELHLTSTVNAEVETINVGGRHILIFDRDFSVSLTRLNIMASDPQPQAVLRWGLAQLAADLILHGDYERAFAALSDSVFLDSAQRPTDDLSLRQAAENTLIQEYFAIAHECVHMAIEDGHAKEFVQLYGEVAQAIARQFAQALDRETIDRARDPLVIFQIEAISQLLQEPRHGHGSTNYEDWLRKKLSLPMSAVALRDARNAIREELTCDALATELTIEAWGNAVGEARVIEAIFDGLSNLVSMEYVHFTGRLAASRALRDPERGLPVALQLLVGRTGSMLNVLVRRIVWRRWLYAREGNSDETAAKLTVFAERYEERVTTVLQLLPEQFNSGYNRMKSRGALLLNPVVAAKIISRGGDPDVLARIFAASKGRLIRREVGA